MIENYLKQYRTEANISTRELASHVGVSQAYISQIENGKKIPKSDTFFYIFDAIITLMIQNHLGISPDSMNYSPLKSKYTQRYLDEIVDSINIKELSNDKERQLLLDIKTMKSDPSEFLYKDTSLDILNGEKIKIELNYLNRKNVQLVIDGEQLTSDDITALTILIEGIRAKHK